MKRIIKASKYDFDSLGQIQLDIQDLMDRIVYQMSNASTDEQYSRLMEAKIFLRKALNKLR